MLDKPARRALEARLYEMDVAAESVFAASLGLHALLQDFGVKADAISAARPEALVWALERGSRSGRVAYQFARDYAGRHPA